MSALELSQMLGNYGEFVGAIAVVATLLYLTIQVRHSRDLLEENRKIALSQVNQSRTALAVDGEKWAADTSEIFVKLEESDDWYRAVDELSPVERMRFKFLMQSLAWRHDNLAYQHELGLLDEVVGAGLARVIALNVPRWDHLGVDHTSRVHRIYEEERAN